LLYVIRQCRAKDLHNWGRLERAARAGAGLRIERAVVHLGTDMGDMIDDLSQALEAAWLVPLMETPTDDATTLLEAAECHAP
jgi:hypothetical protein